MRINTSGQQEYRERLYDDVGELLGENTRSGAIDEACRVVIELLGEPGVASRPGALREALEHEDMTPELAEVLSTDQVELRYEDVEERDLEVD